MPGAPYFHSAYLLYRMSILLYVTQSQALEYISVVLSPRAVSVSFTLCVIAGFLLISFLCQVVRFSVATYLANIVYTLTI